MLPDVDLARIRRYCESRTPAEMRDRVRVDYTVRGRTVTITELSVVGEVAGVPQWIDVPAARLKYDDTTDGWTLYWFDRNSKAHRYQDLDPHQPIDVVLDEIERDPTAIFWG